MDEESHVERSSHAVARAVMRTSLKANVLANYAGQLYVAAINVLLLPMQVSLLGSEAYGLVGFFSMLSGWLQLLDLGLGPTLARETASYRAGNLEATHYRELLRSIQLLFRSVAFAVAISVFALSGVISRHWLHGQLLAPRTVASAVGLMGVVFAFRWQATLPRSVLLGLERQVWVNGLNAGFATLRSVGVLGVLSYVEATPRVFFAYQASIALLELVVLQIITKRSLGRSSPPARWNLVRLRSVAGFSLNVALTSVVWVSVTQLDSLLLSRFLPLAEYAWFSLAVMAANGVTLLAAPIGQAVQPRLTYFVASQDEAALRTTYMDATQMLSAIAVTASATVAIGAQPLLWAWTGNAALATRTAPVLAFYALGNGLLAVVAMTYYLQVARGDLRLHVKGNLVFAVLQLPLVVLATIRAGMLGAAEAWCGANLLFLSVWSLIVHRRFMPGIHLQWLAIDVALPCAVGVVPAVVLCQLVGWTLLTRIETALALGGIGAVAVGLAAMTTKPVRRLLCALRSTTNSIKASL